MSDAAEALTEGNGEGQQQTTTVEQWIGSAPEGVWESPDFFNAMLKNAPDDIREEPSLTAGGRIGTVQSLLRSHVHAQKTMGGEKLAVPKGADDTEAFEAIYKALGRPDTPKDYQISLPQGIEADEAGQKMIDEFLPELHAAGVSNEKANALVGKMATAMDALVKSHQGQLSTNVEQETVALQSEWGGKYKENLTVAKQAAQAVGVDAEAIDALEKQVGFAKVMKMFHTIGTKVTGAGLRGGEGEQGAVSKDELQRQLSAVEEKLRPFVNDNTRTMNPEYKRLLGEKSRLFTAIYGDTPANPGAQPG